MCDTHIVGSEAEYRGGEYWGLGVLERGLEREVETQGEVGVQRTNAIH